MPFWNSAKILKVHSDRLKAEKFLVEGIEEEREKDRVEQGCCELSLGGEAFVTSTEHRLKTRLHKGERVEIPPGQFAALLTKERVWIPDDTLAFISMRASIKFRGLVNVSGFHVDPGFKGNLIFAVYNAGAESVVLSYGQRLFPIWFADLEGPDNERAADPKPYSKKEQNTIRDDIVMNMLGEVASPAELKRDLDALRRSFSQMKAVGVAIVTAILAALATKWFG